jgi:catechol 2,3-dioxygenase-like lactoylglutathione lyase family enzyme
MDLFNVQEPVSVQGADIAKSSFVNAKLAQCRFDDVDLQGTTFTNVNLSGVALTNVNLTGASIANANLTRMTVNGIAIDDMMRAYRMQEERKGAFAGAVLYATNVTRMKEFYQRVFGFTLQRAANGHVVLVSSAFQIVLVEVPASIAASISIEEPPRLRAESPTKLVFATPSIAMVRAAAPAYRAVVLPVERDWDVDGARVCDGNDPEGTVFQLRESPQTRVSVA